MIGEPRVIAYSTVAAEERYTLRSDGCVYLIDRGRARGCYGEYHEFRLPPATKWASAEEEALHARVVAAKAKEAAA